MLGRTNIGFVTTDTSTGGGIHICGMNHLW